MYEYQDQMAKQVIRSLKASKKPVCVAVTTSAGKSAITTKFFNRILQQGGNAVFLGSNLTVLAEQYFNSLVGSDPVKPLFTFSKLTEAKNTQLKVGIVKQLFANPYHVTTIVLDEGHWLYGKSMMNKVIERCNPKNIVILTGTPSHFTENKDRFSIHYLAYSELQSLPRAKRLFSKVSLDLIPVVNRLETKEILSSFLTTAKRNKDDLSKFVVVARNINEAQNVRNILEREFEIKTSISTSKHDPDSIALEEFKSNDSQACVTCNRITAGWSFNDLTAVLDLKAGLMNSSFQLMSRLLRVSRKNPEMTKTYYRVSLKEQHNSSVIFLYKLRALLDDQVYRNFTGKNLEVTYR